MGKPDFGPGDLVVCVDDGPGRAGPALGVPSFLRKGLIYRVSKMNAPGVPLDGMRPASWHVVLLDTASAFPNLGYRAERFRKIDKADEQFTAQIRACKPVKQREPA